MRSSHVSKSLRSLIQSQEKYRRVRSPADVSSRGENIFLVGNRKRFNEGVANNSPQYAITRLSDSDAVPSCESKSDGGSHNGINIDGRR